MKKWTEAEIQYALACNERDIPFYTDCCNVIHHPGYLLDFHHSFDLLIISKEGYGTELEIKASVSVLQSDAGNKRVCRNPRAKDLYFAGPLEIRDALLQYAPEGAGVITVEFIRVDSMRSDYKCRVERKPEIIEFAPKFRDEEIVRLLKLGNRVFWKRIGKEFIYKPKTEEGK
jgi:hypothetical protein